MSNKIMLSNNGLIRLAKDLGYGDSLSEDMLLEQEELTNINGELVSSCLCGRKAHGQCDKCSCSQKE